jgi:hypothetical protein
MKAQAVLQYGLDIIEDETPEQNELAKGRLFMMKNHFVATVCKTV